MEIKTETSPHRLCRKTKNKLISSLGFAQKSDYLAKAKLKKHWLKGRKQRFGFSYMDMLENGASADDLERCVQTARQDMQVIKNDITLLKGAIEKTRKKIHANPAHLGSMKVDEAEQRGCLPVATIVYPSAPSSNYL